MLGLCPTLCDQLALTAVPIGFVVLVLQKCECDHPVIKDRAVQRFVDLTVAGRVALSVVSFGKQLPNVQPVLASRSPVVGVLTNVAANAFDPPLIQAGQVGAYTRHQNFTIARTRQSGVLVSHAQELTWLAELLILQRALPDALAIAQDAISVARRYGERGNEALALHIAGRIKRELADDGADCMLREAERLASACGMLMWPILA